MQRTKFSPLEHESKAEKTLQIFMKKFYKTEFVTVTCIRIKFVQDVIPKPLFSTHQSNIVTPFLIMSGFLLVCVLYGG